MTPRGTRAQREHDGTHADELGLCLEADSGHGASRESAGFSSLRTCTEPEGMPEGWEMHTSVHVACPGARLRVRRAPGSAEPVGVSGSEAVCFLLWKLSPASVRLASQPAEPGLESTAPGALARLSLVLLASGAHRGLSGVPSRAWPSTLTPAALRLPHRPLSAP